MPSVKRVLSSCSTDGGSRGGGHGEDETQPPPSPRGCGLTDLLEGSAVSTSHLIKPPACIPTRSEMQR